MLADRAIDVDGNRLTLLPDGVERLGVLLDVINEAGHRLCLYFYTFSPDETGRRVLAALVAARRRGVDVTVMIDAFGSYATPIEFMDPLVAAGGRCGRFGRLGGRPSTRFLIRNHQKMLIADGERALVGGFNIDDDYFADGGNASNWCDLGLLVEGEAVAGLQDWYDRLKHWTLDSNQRFRTLRSMLRDWRPGVARVQWQLGGPTRRLSGWARQVKADLESGRRLDMVAAYFSPGPGMLRRLRRLARRGEARLILSRRSDNTTTIGASRHLYRRLLRAGLRLFEYDLCKLHMKLIVIDEVVYVGSANFDMRGLFINVELMLRVEDAAFAAAARAVIEQRQEQSREIDWQAYRSMAGPFARLRWFISYLLVGVLDYTVTRRLNFRADPRDTISAS